MKIQNTTQRSTEGIYWPEEKNVQSHLTVVGSCKIFLPFDFSRTIDPIHTQGLSLTSKRIPEQPLFPEWFFLNDPGLNTAEEAVKGYNRGSR